MKGLGGWMVRRGCLSSGRSRVMKNIDRYRAIDGLFTQENPGVT